MSLIDTSDIDPVNIVAALLRDNLWRFRLAIHPLVVCASVQSDHDMSHNRPWELSAALDGAGTTYLGEISAQSIGIDFSIGSQLTLIMIMKSWT